MKAFPADYWLIRIISQPLVVSVVTILNILVLQVRVNYLSEAGQLVAEAGIRCSGLLSVLAPLGLAGSPARLHLTQLLLSILQLFQRIFP